MSRPMELPASPAPTIRTLARPCHHPPRLAEVFDDGPLGDPQDADRAQREQVVDQHDGPGQGREVCGALDTDRAASPEHERRQGDRAEELQEVLEPEEPPRNIVHVVDEEDRQLDGQSDRDVVLEIDGIDLRDHAVEPEPERHEHRSGDERGVRDEEEEPPLEQGQSEQALDRAARIFARIVYLFPVLMMTSITRCWSAGSRPLPLGRHRPFSKISSATLPPSHPAAFEHRLHVHRLPDGPALDVLGLEGEPDGFAVRPEQRRIDQDDGQPVVRLAVIRRRA